MVKEGYEGDPVFRCILSLDLAKIHEARKVDERLKEFMGDCSEDYLEQNQW